jgi:hypothetical protein
MYGFFHEKGYLFKTSLRLSSTEKGLRQPHVPAFLDRSLRKGNKYRVIICTRCGKKNDDENRFCEQCGKKLQSSRRTTVLPDQSTSPLERFTHPGVSDDSRSALNRMLEAWGYVLLLGGVAGACAWFDTWWPLYPAVALIALIARLRKI